MDPWLVNLLVVAVGSFTLMLGAQRLAAMRAPHRRVGRGSSPGGSPAPVAVPFLGGYPPESHAWSRFHVRFYVMALILVAFEMEMMFMYPWAVVFVVEGVTALAEMGVFLAVLGLGVLYAWREGAFRWQ